MMSSIFTKILNKEVDGHIIYEDDNFFAILDIFPKAKGHTLLISKQEYKNIYELPDDISSKVLKVAKKISKAIVDTLGAEGIRLRQNNGKLAGQEVMHYHMHIHPYYKENYSEKEMKEFKTIAAKLRKALI